MYICSIYPIDEEVLPYEMYGQNFFFVGIQMNLTYNKFRGGEEF